MKKQYNMKIKKKRIRKTTSKDSHWVNLGLVVYQNVYSNEL